MLSRLCFSVFFSKVTAYKTDSDHTRDYTKLFPVCKVVMLQVTVNKIEVVSSFRLISDDFRLKGPQIAIKDTLISC